MSELVLPTHIAAERSEDEAKKLASQLPKPQGYRLLCAIPKVEEAFESGILKADETRSHEEILTTVLFVVSMGPDAYKDEKRFPSGPYCKEGDFVLVKPYAGIRLKVHETEMRIIADDMVEAVVENPAGIRRA